MTSLLDQESQKQLKDLDRRLEAADTMDDGLKIAMGFLKDKRHGYYWVGVYKLQGDTLVLGPYFGPKTDHKRIPVGKGVCGTAVAENKNQIVADVRELGNYLACNLDTRSEIVVLVRDPKTQKILGQIDVDSTEINAFGKTEEAFLEEVAAMIAGYF